MLEKPTSGSNDNRTEFRVVRRHAEGGVTWLEITKVFYWKGQVWTFDPESPADLIAGGDGEPDAACLRNLRGLLAEYGRCLDKPILDEKRDFKAPVKKRETTDGDNSATQ